MKVLHVIPSIGPARGGPSQVVLDICRQLARGGVEVALATTDDNGAGRLDVPLGRATARDGYEVWHFGRTTREYTFSWPLTRWLARRLSDFDFVHAHAVFSHAPVAAALLARRRGVPYAITPHGILLSWGLRARRTRLKSWSFRVLERRLLDRAAFIHAASAREQRELAALRLQAPIELIHFGLDPPPPLDPAAAREALCREVPALRDRTVFLFLGRLHPVKGFDLLLPALALARERVPRIALAVAGTGDAEFESWLASRISQLGLQSHVTRLGFLDERTKWSALAACDALVLPSHSESFGLAALEAIACGRPVLLSDQVAFGEQVAQAGAGSVVPPRAESLGQALVELATDAARRERMGQAARELFQRSFTLDRVAQRLLGCYRAGAGRAAAHDRA